MNRARSTQVASRHVREERFVVIVIGSIVAAFDGERLVLAHKNTVARA